MVVLNFFCLDSNLAVLYLWACLTTCVSSTWALIPVTTSALQVPFLLFTLALKVDIYSCILLIASLISTRNVRIFSESN